jgi:hypothetical protein
VGRVLEKRKEVECQVLEAEVVLFFWTAPIVNL